MSNKSILIIAGEPSGDLLGAYLAQSLQSLDPSLKLAGMGGKHMREAGVSVFINIDKLAVVGLLEVLRQFRHIYQAIRTLKKYFQKTTPPPDLVVFIDYPGFNLYMAKKAKKAGIKVLYYVSPQIWAWRYGRIKKIKKIVDHMAVLFDFEKDIYQKERIPVSFVGHPLANAPKLLLSRQAICKQFDLDPNKLIVALFPGSREQEINKLLPILMQSTQLIQLKIPTVQFILPVASNLNFKKILSFVDPKIKVTYNNTDRVLAITHAAVAASGTVTLEIALQQVPVVIIYKVSPLTFWLGKKIIHVPFIGLCNLVAQERVAVELLQKAATPQAIADEVLRLLNDYNYRHSIIEKLARIHMQLDCGNAAKNIAETAIYLLK